jgi:glycosyltransferase involved in cell wall biosynthesis
MHMVSGEAKTCSLVVCTKDRADELARCLRSFLSVATSSYEIVVVDASNSANLAINSGLAGLLGSGVVHLPSEAGLTLQRNVGAEAATGDVVLYVDDDVVFIQDPIPALLANWTERVAGRTGLVIEPSDRRPSRFARLLLFDSARGGRTNCAGRAIPPRWPATGSEAAYDATFLPGCFMAYRRDLVIDLRYDETRLGYGLGEDAEFASRARQFGRLEVVRRAVAVHRESGSGIEHDGNWATIEKDERIGRLTVSGQSYWPASAAIATLYHLTSVRRKRHKGRCILEIFRVSRTAYLEALQAKRSAPPDKSPGARRYPRVWRNPCLSEVIAQLQAIAPDSALDTVETGRTHGGFTTNCRIVIELTEQSTGSKRLEYTAIEPIAVIRSHRSRLDRRPVHVSIMALFGG